MRRRLGGSAHLGSVETVAEKTAIYNAVQPVIDQVDKVWIGLTNINVDDKDELFSKLRWTDGKPYNGHDELEHVWADGSGGGTVGDVQIDGSDLLWVSAKDDKNNLQYALVTDQTPGFEDGGTFIEAEAFCR